MTIRYRGGAESSVLGASATAKCEYGVEDRWKKSTQVVLRGNL